MPAIFEMLNIKNLKRFDGKSLMEFKNGDGKIASRITFLERRDVPDDMRLKYPNEYGKGKEFAIRTDEWKFIFKEVEENELYNLREDPFEVNNLIAAEPELARSLEDSVYTWLAGSVSEGQSNKSNLDPETLEQLKSLGYIR
jgi:arylsulfatase A-like enzyme